VKLCISCWEGGDKTLRNWNNEQTFWTYPDIMYYDEIVGDEE
jgi:hypothetical protein